MSSKVKYLSAFILLALVLSLFASGAQAQEKLVVSKIVSPAAQQDALKFWTRDQIAAAQPMAMPVDFGLAAPDTVGFDLQSLGLPGNTAAGKSAPNANAVAKAAFGSDWEALANDMAFEPDGFDAEGTSQTYSYYTINSWLSAQKIYPHKWVGRLSFKTTGGTSYCSATAISGNNFVTAAHCVYDTTNNRWYSGWVFTPAYRNGTAPYGSFSGTVCTILTAWVNLSGSFSINGWSKYDVAVCTAGKNAAGQTLNGAVGYAGRQWNYGYARHYFNMGYPWNNYQNVSLGTTAGKYLRTCAAESFQQTTDTRGMGCYYGPGISGGPWMIGYQQNVVSGYVDGVNSGLYVGTQNMYGPRFTSNNIVPICNARGC